MCRRVDRVSTTIILFASPYIPYICRGRYAGLQLVSNVSTSYLPIFNLSQSELRHQRRLELDVQVSSRSIRDQKRLWIGSKGMTIPISPEPHYYYSWTWPRA
jgi:hypothetical protein